MDAALKKIIDEVKTFAPKADFAKIEAAYEFSKVAHAGQKRFSGEPYFVHPVAATMNLLALHPDDDTISACLLHDVVEDTEADIVEIEKKFGTTIASLCLDMEKLGTVRYQGQERQIENLRKMFVAMARDIRVIFIKLADRLHNMETLEHVRPDKQKRIARETLEVYAPIAARLGLFEFKARLEDLAFRTLHPDEYAKVAKALAGSSTGRKNFIETTKKKLQTILSKAKIKAEVTGRTKHLYSIWRKLKLKNYPSIDEIYDLFALRVIVDSTEDCYSTLGAIHNNLTPLSHRFKDFIAVPKPNGYRSLHTTVIGLNRNSPTEIQIRTREMHEQAERGAAAHFVYSEKKKSVKADESKLKWIRGLVELHESMTDNTEFISSLSSDVFEDRIFVLTPRGDVFDLPAGATPIDFAYTVHTEIGHRCTGAKVNGKIAKLDAKLKNGDIIEILTKKDAKPNRFWLSFTKTNSAKSKIRTYFSSLGRNENIAIGRDLINKKLERLGKPKLDADLSILKNYKRQNLDKRGREALLERIGNGSVSSSAVVKDLLELEEVTVQKSRKKPIASLTTAHKKDEVLIEGVGGIATKLAKCCTPKTGDEVVAVMSRAGATIHKKNCKQIVRVADERKLKAVFASDVKSKLVKIEVAARNRVGMLHDIAEVIAEMKINIADLSLKTSDKHEILHELTIEIGSLDELEELLSRLEKIEGITRAVKI
ncbi:MAG: bifunctional (p)ppGpp synthetase/guanosine-3',5'-bis(diphosphate) 3'-pyrophosphohydrolase [Candidatus Peribacteraceae bacterium]|nr:bifunctional (p)ppGpp synthetase/guanosine-3',5'-bis(diphosphate) 3'-pyrophosphohydrolase [Candidatus Peribacteraceae bacterium]